MLNSCVNPLSFKSGCAIPENGFKHAFQLAQIKLNHYGCLIAIVEKILQEKSLYAISDEQLLLKLHGYFWSKIICKLGRITGQMSKTPNVFYQYFFEFPKRLKIYKEFAKVSLQLFNKKVVYSQDALAIHAYFQKKIHKQRGALQDYRNIMSPYYLPRPLPAELTTTRERLPLPEKLPYQKQKIASLESQIQLLTMQKAIFDMTEDIESLMHLELTIAFLTKKLKKAKQREIPGATDWSFRRLPLDAFNALYYSANTMCKLSRLYSSLEFLLSSPFLALEAKEMLESIQAAMQASYIKKLKIYNYVIHHWPGFENKTALSYLSCSNAGKIWAKGYKHIPPEALRGLGATVAIYDIGHVKAHKSLKIAMPKNTLNSQKSVADQGNHATAVASLIAGLPNRAKNFLGGLAIHARVASIDVRENISTAFKPNIINISLTFNISEDLPVGVPVQYTSWEEKIEQVLQSSPNGRLLVFALGNGIGVPAVGLDVSKSSAYKFEFLQNVRIKPYSIIVGNLERVTSDHTVFLHLSSNQPGDFGELALCCLGSQLTIARNHTDYATASGTSLSAPLVSAAAAILEGIGLKPLEIKDCLLEGASPIVITDGKARLIERQKLCHFSKSVIAASRRVFGCGLLNIEGALEVAYEKYPKVMTKFYLAQLRSKFPLPEPKL